MSRSQQEETIVLQILDHPQECWVSDDGSVNVPVLDPLGSGVLRGYREPVATDDPRILAMVAEIKETAREVAVKRWLAHQYHQILSEQRTTHCPRALAEDPRIVARIKEIEARGIYDQTIEKMRRRQQGREIR